MLGQQTCRRKYTGPGPAHLRALHSSPAPAPPVPLPAAAATAHLAARPGRLAGRGNRTHPATTLQWIWTLQRRQQQRRACARLQGAHGGSSGAHRVARRCCCGCCGCFSRAPSACWSAAVCDKQLASLPAHPELLLRELQGPVVDTGWGEAHMRVWHAMQPARACSLRGRTGMVRALHVCAPCSLRVVTNACRLHGGLRGHGHARKLQGSCKKKLQGRAAKRAGKQRGSRRGSKTEWRFTLQRLLLQRYSRVCAPEPRAVARARRPCAEHWDELLVFAGRGPCKRRPPPPLSPPAWPQRAHTPGGPAVRSGTSTGGVSLLPVGELPKTPKPQNPFILIKY